LPIPKAPKNPSNFGFPESYIDGLFYQAIFACPNTTVFGQGDLTKKVLR
jgi:hypothetical protein